MPMHTPNPCEMLGSGLPLPAASKYPKHMHTTPLTAMAEMKDQTPSGDPTTHSHVPTLPTFSGTHRKLGVVEQEPCASNPTLPNGCTPARRPTLNGRVERAAEALVVERPAHIAHMHCKA